MQISISRELEQFIADEVKSGRFTSYEEVVNAAVIQLRDREELSNEDLSDLRAEIDVGIAQVDRKEFAKFTAQDIIDEGHAKMAAGKKAG